MKEKDIRDDEIRVIGEDDKAKFNGWKWLLLLLVGIVIGFIVWALLPQKPEDPKENPEQGVFEPGNDTMEQTVVKLPLAKAEETGKGHFRGWVISLHFSGTSPVSGSVRRVFAPLRGAG